jgi:predicted DNA-binding protein
MADYHKTVIRLPKDLHTEARIKALREGKTLTAVIQELLEHWIKSPPKREEEETPAKKPKGK